MRLRTTRANTFDRPLKQRLIEKTTWAPAHENRFMSYRISHIIC